MNLSDFISAMPKAELHLHFEGTLLPEDLLTLAEKNRVRLGVDTVEGIRALYRYRNFDDFKTVLLLGVRVIRHPEDFYYLMQKLGPRLSQQNIQYAEIFWTPQIYRRLGFGYDELFDALHMAAGEIESTYGIRINWIPDIVRSRGAYAWEIMEWASSDLARQRGVVALGLAGPETSQPLAQFIEVFREAERRGLPANPHAGEGTSPAHVRETIEALNPRRIGHGIKAVADPDLIRLLVDKDVTLEICPTSNLALGHSQDYKSHPLLALMNSGCRLTINTDDPVLFGTDLNREYLHAMVDCGLSPGQLEQAALNAVYASYLPEPDKARMHTRFADDYTRLRKSLLQAGPAHTAGDRVSIAGPAAVTRSGVSTTSPFAAPASTSLHEERQEQARWQLKPRHAGIQIFERLVSNEFLEPEQIENAQFRLFRRVLRHAVAQVPYYQQLFAEQHMHPREFRTRQSLERLPVMDKAAVRAHALQLRARQLPRGEEYFGALASSGTTGRPVRVHQTVRNNTLFHVLTQRQYRWYRMDPQGTLAYCRLASQLPRTVSGAQLQNGTSLRLPEWRYASTYFHTGPWIGFSITNPLELQLQWLRREQPDYLASYSESLEHLCFASEGQLMPGSIKGLIAISEQLTPLMWHRIEDTFNAPVHQSYGLNEIGLVAVKCRSGRYHVHMEHCIVEIVDQDGLQCLPGSVGRIVISALNNYAMPLIRYDTDDLAMAVAGPCPCGRTLPSFGEITGRYSRIAYLPEGTLTCVAAIRGVIDTMPDDVAVNFRQFQLHQFRDSQFELRLVTTGALTPAFYDRISAAWQDVSDHGRLQLSIRMVNAISRTPGGKNLDFTSDHMPTPDA